MVTIHFVSFSFIFCAFVFFFNDTATTEIYTLSLHDALPILVSDAAIAVATSLFLFMIPSKDRPKEMLLKWSKVRELPWGILLLFGGGFAIAGGFNSSGLSNLIGNLFANLDIDSPILLVIIVCVVLTFLTEITSNTATTNLILPILAKASAVLGLDQIGRASCRERV